ncbi:MAG: DUF4878 domain-containing protein [Gordonia sp. (in: high G+C Gram-positive bacteria)]
MKLRKSLAAAAIAGAALVSVAGCSDDNSTSDAASNASAASTSAASTSTVIDGLNSADAQTILRTALTTTTSSADLENVVDTSNPATKAAIQGYAKAATAAGYGPEVYTVTRVATSPDEATATVAVKSPHAPQPVNITLSYVNVDGKWKLSGDAVTQLTSIMGHHGS